MTARVTIYQGPTAFGSTLDDGAATLEQWRHAVETGEHSLISITDRTTGRTAHMSTAKVEKITVEPRA